MKIDNIQLTKNFKLTEFRCKDGSNLIKFPDCKLVNELQKVRDFINKPITVSGYRNEKYNTLINGDNNSYHMKGMAADITVKNMSPEELYYIACKFDFGGIGIYDGHVHVDIGGIGRRWDARKSNKNKKLVIEI